ncbi:DUF1617 family protein [Enterococcus sp. N249-2]
MKIMLRNYELAPTLNFLQGMDLKAASQSRQRSKLRNLVMEALEGFQEAQKELYDLYAEKDSNGELVISEDGTDYKIRKDLKKKFLEEMNTLLSEEVIIEGGTYARNITAFGEILAKYEGVISGKEADIYDRLMDEFEKEENQNVKD